jgi:hypothetical protein
VISPRAAPIDGGDLSHQFEAAVATAVVDEQELHAARHVAETVEDLAIERLERFELVVDGNHDAEPRRRIRGQGDPFSACSGLGGRDGALGLVHPIAGRGLRPPGRTSWRRVSGIRAAASPHREQWIGRLDAPREPPPPPGASGILLAALRLSGRMRAGEGSAVPRMGSWGRPREACRPCRGAR